MGQGGQSCRLGELDGSVVYCIIPIKSSVGRVGLQVFTMWQFLQTPAAQGVIWVAVALTLSVIAFYVVRNFRDQIEDDGGTSEHLTKFREMEQEGVLSDAEFRTIKTVLGSRLRDDLNDHP